VAYKDFRIGLRVADVGESAPYTLYTPWASEAPGKPGGISGWTKFATNFQQNDPDGVSIGLETRPIDNGTLVTHDFRIGVGAWDKPETQLRPPQVTPWVTEILKLGVKRPAGFTGPASDMDRYDPDAFCVGLLTEPTRIIPGRVNFRLAVRVADATGPGQPLTDLSKWYETKTIDEGGSWTEFAMDKDRYDFDTIELAFVIESFKPG